MADRILTLQELNWATLAGQMLLERESVPVTDAIERLIGLQSRVPNPPYIGLWSRLQGFGVWFAVLRPAQRIAAQHRRTPASGVPGHRATDRAVLP